MEKLVFELYFTDGCTYGNTVPVPFEFSSKEDFVFMVLEKIQESKRKAKEENSDYANIILFEETLQVMNNFDYGSEQYREEDIENLTFTIEEWFNKIKKNKI
ncbi:MAG: hypothetical protein ABIP51_01060 [Bacteroidia bacterium]